MARGRLKKIQEEVQHELATLKGQEKAQEGQFIKEDYEVLGSENLGKKWERQAKSGETFPQSLVQKDTQSVNAKVEALSKGKEERLKVASMHASEGSFEEGNCSEVSRSSQSSLGERCERQVRVERNRREEMRERHDRIEEPRKEELDISKCKIPPFLGNFKCMVYVDWGLKVEQILGYFNLHGRMVVRLVTLEFGDYALVWWT
ncbi:hypothetical protein CR513_24718, partial [Mucuna pruriens]